MKAVTIMNKAPVEWEKVVDRMKSADRNELVTKLEGIAHRAALLAGYVDARYGNGCGDLGHKSAVKSANKAGNIVWCKVFGYNAHIDLTL